MEAQKGVPYPGGNLRIKLDRFFCFSCVVVEPL